MSEARREHLSELPIKMTQRAVLTPHTVAAARHDAIGAARREMEQAMRAAFFPQLVNRGPLVVEIRETINPKDEVFLEIKMVATARHAALPDLETQSTNDLIDQIFSRCETGAIVMEKRGTAGDFVLMRIIGEPKDAIAALELAKHEVVSRVTEERRERSPEDGEDGINYAG